MMNKSVMAGKPFAVLGDFWQPILDRRPGKWNWAPGPLGESNGRLVHMAATPTTWQIT